MSHFKLILVLCLSMTSSVFAENSIHVQAHRGASALAMENTLSAFEKAVSVGANSFELDIVVTKDGKLAVFHDFVITPENVKRVDGKSFEGSIPLRSLTLKQLREYYVDLPKRLVEPNQLTVEQRAMPTLEEVFKLIAESKDPNAKKIIVDVEIKSHPDHPEYGPAPLEYAKLVKQAIDSSGVKSQVVVRSFDLRTLEALKKLDSSIPIAALVEEGYMGFEGDYEKLVRDLKPEIVAPNKKHISKALVDRLHKVKVKVMPWTVNEPTDWQSMIQSGVDGITTDNPDALSKFLKGKGIPQAKTGGEVYGCNASLASVAD